MLGLIMLPQKMFQPFCGEPCVGFIMTKCYDGKNAKTNACGSGIQAPCCYAYAFSQCGQKLYELAFKSLYSKVLRYYAVWQYWFWSFQTGGTKLERFLPKNQHTQRKLLNLENWVNGEVSKSGHHFTK